jgi:hypothetical protein
MKTLVEMLRSRLQTLTAGPESFVNIKTSLLEIDTERMTDSDSFDYSEKKR